MPNKNIRIPTLQFIQSLLNWICQSKFFNSYMIWLLQIYSKYYGSIPCKSLWPFLFNGLGLTILLSSSQKTTIIFNPHSALVLEPKFYKLQLIWLYTKSFEIMSIKYLNIWLSTYFGSIKHRLASQSSMLRARH